MEQAVTNMNGCKQDSGTNEETTEDRTTVASRTKPKGTKNRPKSDDQNLLFSKDGSDLSNLKINGIQPMDCLISDNTSNMNSDTNGYHTNCNLGACKTEPVYEKQTDCACGHSSTSCSHSEDNLSVCRVNSNSSENTERLERTLNKLEINEEFENQLNITYINYETEEQMPDMMQLITKDLSEPYSVYTYRYFLHNWPHLSHLAYYESECVGAIVCKLDMHRKNVWRGYIAMLVVHKNYRRHKIGSTLVKKAIKKMIDCGCDEVVLETEVTNKGALGLYENLGFVRDKRLLRYYLNGVDAWRLKLWLK